MKSSAFKAIFDIRRSELPFALLMFTYFFLVITSFWILKPIKKSLFIQHYDAHGLTLGAAVHFSAPQAELIAKILNMVVAFVAVVVFTWLVRRFRRQYLTFIFTAFFLMSYAGFAVVIGDPGELTVWSFYLFGDLFSTLMVATFFAFVNDSVTSDAAKRLYGLIGLGGVTGGVFGSTMVRALIGDVSTPGWLWLCGAIGVVIIVVAYAAGRIVDRSPPVQQEGEPKATKANVAVSGKTRNPAIEGAVLVLRSPYLLSIVGIVGLYEIASTVMDFQFTSAVAHYLEGPAIGKQFATVFAITNVVAMFVQLFLTSFVMSHVGVGVALLVLPVAALLGSAAFMAIPGLWIGSMLNTTDNAFSYSINQSAKEALYVPTSTDEKYKAKAFIDMFVQRLAKVLAVVVSLGITFTFTAFASVRWLSIFTILVLLVWMVAARYAGRTFREMTTGTERAPVEAD